MNYTEELPFSRFDGIRDKLLREVLGQQHQTLQQVSTDHLRRLGMNGDDRGLRRLRLLELLRQKLEHIGTTPQRRVDGDIEPIGLDARVQPRRLLRGDVVRLPQHGHDRVKDPFPRGRVVTNVAENPLDTADVDGGVVEKVEDEDTRQTLIVEDGLGGDFGGAVNVADVKRVALGVLVVIPAGAPSTPAVPVGVDGVMTRADPEASTAPAAGSEIHRVRSGPAATPSSKGCEKSNFIAPKKSEKKSEKKRKKKRKNSEKKFQKKSRKKFQKKSRKKSQKKRGKSSEKNSEKIR